MMRRNLLVILSLALSLVLVIVLVELHRGTLNRDVTCRYNLRQIYAAIQDYTQREGAFPSSLEALHLSAQAFPWGVICPESREQYVLIPAASKPGQTDPRAILAADPAPAHGGEGNVLYADGQVGTMPAKRLEGLLRLIKFRPAMMPQKPDTKPTTAESGN